MPASPLSADYRPIANLDPHHLEVFLLQVGGLLLLAFALGRIAVRLGLPPIVGELTAGVLAGPSVLGHLLPGFSGWILPHEVEQMHLLDAVGQLGVLLLVGLTGAHLDLGLVRRRGATAARVSGFGIVVPLALGVACGLLLPATLVPDGVDRGTFALFLGVALGISAIPVIAKTLLELRMLHRDVGQLTLCAVTIDDLIGWILLSVVSAMATTGVQTGGVLWAVAKVALVLALALLAGPLARRAFRTVRPRLGDAACSAIVVGLVLLAAAGTQALGLEAVFGAFLAGVVLGGPDGVGRMPALDAAVMNVLAPVFFVTAGLRMDLTALARPVVLLAAAVLLASAIAGKFAGAYAGARLSRLGHWEGLALGAGMNARGVIEVVIAMVGLRLGVLPPEMYTVIVLIAVVTSVMAPPVLRRSMAHLEESDEERERGRPAAVREPAGTASPA
ncbi:cation:proton antiporter [Actinomadura parmotrematis]|uniref:Cation:proton antiporter n=1 Tax=Actinomadura parmotrematis TaxID=2864039 RepID=A0ABS7FL46_9ACTN|nr:cation:proton antiporter [Actinomadura parmotrematis]MBW8480970.1 cation:proton antiporter [Actinomadura parmotrematis]